MTSKKLREDIKRYIDKGFRFAYHYKEDAGLKRALDSKMVTGGKELAEEVSSRMAINLIGVDKGFVWDLKEELEKL